MRTGLCWLSSFGKFALLVLCLLLVCGIAGRAGSHAHDLVNGDRANAQRTDRSVAWFEKITATNATANGTIYTLTYTVRHFADKTECSNLQMKGNQDGKQIFDQALVPLPGYYCECVKGPEIGNCGIAKDSNKKNAVYCLTQQHEGVEYVVTYQPGSKVKQVLCNIEKLPFLCGAYTVSNKIKFPNISRDSASDNVTAELRYSRDFEDKQLLHVLIRRRKLEQNSRIHLSRYASVDGILVHDLNGDREPEIYVAIDQDPWTVWIFEYDPYQKKYQQRSFSLPGRKPSLQQLNGDRVPELVTTDNAFASVFPTLFPEDGPLRLLRYSQGKLVDVTASFPQELLAHASQLLRKYEVIPFQGYESILASYVADMARAGRKDEAMKKAHRVFRTVPLGTIFGEMFRDRYSYTLNVFFMRLKMLAGYIGDMVCAKKRDEASQKAQLVWEELLPFFTRLERALAKAEINRAQQ